MTEKGKIILPDFWLDLLSLRSYNDNMIRTQISLDKSEYAEAKKVAKEMGMSLAEYFRRALQNFLPRSDKAPWMKYQGLVESGRTQSDEEFDEIVYGSK